MYKRQPSSSRAAAARELEGCTFAPVTNETVKREALRTLLEDESAVADENVSPPPPPIVA